MFIFVHENSNVATMERYVRAPRVMPLFFFFTILLLKAVAAPNQDAQCTRRKQVQKKHKAGAAHHRRTFNLEMKRNVRGEQTKTEQVRRTQAKDG